MIRNKEIIFLISLCFGVTGCSNLLTSKQNVDQFYTVNAVNYHPKADLVVDYAVMVEPPTIAKGLDSNKIMMMRSSQRQDYFANARWSDMLGKLIQSNVVESFENSEVLERMSSDQTDIRPDYLLFLEIYDFQAEYTEITEAPVIHIKLVAKLVNFPERNLLASFTVETMQDAQENNIEDIMEAFDQAFAGAQRMLIDEMVDYFAQ